MGSVPGCVRSCSPVTDPPRSNQASFEVACITKSKNIQHAIRLANTMVFSTSTHQQIYALRKESHHKCKVDKISTIHSLTTLTTHPTPTGGGRGGHPTPLTHPHPQGGGGGTLPLGVGEGGSQAPAHIYTPYSPSIQPFEHEVISAEHIFSSLSENWILILRE